MNTKDTGNLAESKFLAKFIELDYNVLQPFGDNCKYDLVIEKNGKFSRVQIKHARIHKGKVVIENRSVKPKSNTSKAVYTPYTANDIDYLAGYLSDTQMYLVPIANVAKWRVHLNLTAPKNGQMKGVKMASNYQI